MHAGYGKMVLDIVISWKQPQFRTTRSSDVVQVG